MLNRKDLEQQSSSVLAVLCQKIADVTEGSTAELALFLKHEWASLQTPPMPNLQEEPRWTRSDRPFGSRCWIFLMDAMTLIPIQSDEGSSDAPKGTL